MILRRVAQHVKDQNWTAIGTDFLIVVTGVVIGFQVTAWGQARSDAVREQTYLRQLTADLAETERIVRSEPVKVANAHVRAADSAVAGATDPPDPLE